MSAKKADFQPPMRAKTDVYFCGITRGWLLYVPGPRCGSILAAWEASGGVLRGPGRPQKATVLLEDSVVTRVLSESFALFTFFSSLREKSVAGEIAQKNGCRDSKSGQISWRIPPEV